MSSDRSISPFAAILIAVGLAACGWFVGGGIRYFKDAERYASGHPVTVELPGGRLEVEVLPDWRVFMTGPAEEIYHGDLSLEFIRHLE